MKIKALEVYLLGSPQEQRPHWVSHFPVPAANELLVVLHTDSGLSGFGLASSNGSLEQTAAMFDDGLKEFILGADALDRKRQDATERGPRPRPGFALRHHRQVRQAHSLTAICNSDL